MLKQSVQTVIMSPENKIPRIFPLMSMLYITFSISSMVLAYKVIGIRGITITGSAVVMPFRYMFGDIIAEIYGYYIAKRMIWFLIICWFTFSLTTICVIHLPSPVEWNNASAYEIVLGRTINTVSATLIAVLIGSNLNIYFVSKWRVLVRGKIFWLRSIGSSAIGELIQYGIALPIMYFRDMQYDSIIRLIIFNFIVQIVLLLIISIPANLLMIIIKKFEGIDAYDQTIRFNPFVLS